MSQPLYSLLVNACPERRKAPVAWMEELPSDLVGLVVPPVSFSIQRDGEIVLVGLLGKVLGPMITRSAGDVAVTSVVGMADIEALLAGL